MACLVQDLVVACVGGGSNAIGMFNAFLGDKEARSVWTWFRRDKPSRMLEAADGDEWQQRADACTVFHFWAPMDQHEINIA